MKKLTFLSLIAVAALTLASCSSLDSKISKYEKACKEGNVTEAAVIASEIDEKYKNDITEEQAQRILNASIECSSAAASSVGVEMPDSDMDIDF